MKTKKVVTIDVKKWCKKTYCDHSTGKYCALGFAVKSLNPQCSNVDIVDLLVSDIDLINLDDVRNEENEGIATINDDYSGEKRRKKLKELFNKAGFQLKFKNLPKR